MGQSAEGRCALRILVSIEPAHLGLGVGAVCGVEMAMRAIECLQEEERMVRPSRRYRSRWNGCAAGDWKSRTSSHSSSMLTSTPAHGRSCHFHGECHVCLASDAHEVTATESPRHNGLVVFFPLVVVTRTCSSLCSSSCALPCTNRCLGIGLALMRRELIPHRTLENLLPTCHGCP